MTPEEAYHFYEEDEDPEKIFAIFDAGPKSVTSPPVYAAWTPGSRIPIYQQAAGLYGELKAKMLRGVSASGPASYALGIA